MYNIKENISELMLKYRFAIKMLETQLDILIKEYEFKYEYNPVEHIKSRIKSKESAFEKLEKKGYEVNLKNFTRYVHDMIGIRIVCSFLSDVYSVVDMIKTSKQFKIKEERDYIKNPKDTGYMSYHLIVLVPIHLSNRIEYIPAEIQIRTIAMDFWASLDHKIQYKFEGKVPDRVKEEMFNCSYDIKALDDKMHLLNEIVKNYNE